MIRPTVLAVLAAAAVAGGAPGHVRGETAALWTDLPRAQRRAPPMTLADLADRARPAVVHVRGTLTEAPARKTAAAVTTMSVGSGFLIDKSGYIVTNEHVIRGVTDLRVTLYDGREMPGCVVGADDTTDIALLKVVPRGPLPVLPLTDSDIVRVGEPVLAIGSPFGFKHSVTAGIVSAKERVIDRGANDGEPGAGTKPYSFFIQTDASINVGNSGGPLIDGHGAVIGVNAAFWGGPQPSQGVSFAIPINIVKVLVPRLRDEGDAPRSYLGVSSQPLTAALSESLRLPAARGALIANVEPGSVAEQAGLEPGDVVVTWAGKAVSSEEDFKIYAQLTAPRTRVILGVFRSGKAGERSLTTRADPKGKPRPRHQASCQPAAQAPTSALGFDTADVPAGRARTLPGGRGVEVVRVTGGAAREAGLLAGDVLLRAGRMPLGTVDDWRRILRDTPAGTPILLLVRQDGEDYWTTLVRP